MLTTLALAVLTQTSPLAVVPDDAYVLAHCRDVGALRARAEGNDWVRLLGSDLGQPMLRDLTYATHGELDELLAVARTLSGETVLFDTGRVAGLVTRPPADRAALVEALRAWLPGEGAERRSLEVAGARVELVAWPDAIDGWSGRAGHFAAWVDHADVLAVWSGDDAEAVSAAVRQGLAGLHVERSAPIVTAWRAQGGGATAGLELYVDFTPLVAEAEAALEDAVRDVLPSPAGLLGLESGAWLFASFDLAQGAPVDVRARLHLPPDSLAAKLADTWGALPATLPADLPPDVWAFEAWNWDLARFYTLLRAAYQEASEGRAWEQIDAGVQGAEAMVGVNPIDDVLAQLAGDVVIYLTEPASASDGRRDEMRWLEALGLQLGLRDGAAFLDAIESLIEVGGLASVLEAETIEGADAYLLGEEAGDELDGGLAFLPRAFVLSPSRRTLERSLRALARVDGASLVSGSAMAAEIDANAGACFLSCVELTPLRAMLPEELGPDFALPAQGDLPARDPFDARLVASVRRTADGFEAWLRTR